MPEELSYHYDYSRLDKFLQSHYDPKTVAYELDETMSDLVDHTALDETYGQVLPERYYILKSLRDIFCKLEKVQP
jgi:hypothetical protein